MQLFTITQTVLKEKEHLTSGTFIENAIKEFCLQIKRGFGAHRTDFS